MRKWRVNMADGERVGVVGLGYVGLPVAIEVARHFEDTIGFDIDATRIHELCSGRDRTGEVDSEALGDTNMRFTAAPEDLENRTFFVVAVPTPVDSSNRPDLSMLIKASEMVGPMLRRGCVVVYESTVYPGVTEEICGPALERTSGLRAGSDFGLAYSPERINPGDREHTLKTVSKIVSAQDEETLDRVARVYSRVVPAGLHRAPNIKVAEAAKVIENTQRDLNIALMNELAIICGRLGIRTADVLAAARTKWNFLPFTPGLVGGHCIGVDPYYLTAKAEQLGYHPEVILAGRRINDRMGEYIAISLVKLLIGSDIRVREARVGILGLAFKEDVPDLRNSRVPDIVDSLKEYGIAPLVHDSLVSKSHALAEYGIELQSLDALTRLDALVLAVPHREYQEAPIANLTERLRDGGVLIDVKSILPPGAIPPNVRLWSL